MEERESSFGTETDDIIKNLCVLDHEMYRYIEFLTEALQYIYSCQISTEFIQLILKGKVS